MLVEEAYRFARPRYLVKSISQVSKTKELGIHVSRYQQGHHAVDVRRHPVDSPFNYNYLGRPQGLILNHYGAILPARFSFLLFLFPNHQY